MADQLSKKRSRESDDSEEKPLKLLKQSEDLDEEEEDEEDDVSLDTSDIEEPSLNLASDLMTSQLMAFNSTLMLNKNLLLSNMAQTLMLQSSMMVTEST